MGRSDDLYERAIAQTHRAHQLLAHLLDQLLLGEVLADFARHQLSLLLVRKAEILSHNLEVLLVDVLQVAQFGPSAETSHGHISTVIAAVVRLLRKLANYLAEPDEIDTQESVQILVYHLLKLAVKHDKIFRSFLQVQHLELRHNEV
mmetsp:Transcript_17493/g.22160  ORF Transcript_17493/g.22160 Transcript_17493/m.22160 type:complete len:147 (-) Transcript_17493:1661-2101(-)